MNSVQIYIYYEKFREKIKRVKDYRELVCLYEIFEKSVANPVELKLIKSLVNKQRFAKSIPLHKFCSFIINVKNWLELENNQMNVLNILNETKLLTEDIAQISTIDAIIEMNNVKIMTVSPYKATNILNRYKVKKKCPHCNKSCIEYNDVLYVICGYSGNKGYDWTGCSNDWCFQCGKRLCKSWDKNELYNKINRFHDKKCCKIDAQRLGCDYYEEYCQCEHFFVKR